MLILDPGVILSEGDEDVMSVDGTDYLDSGETFVSGEVDGDEDLTLGSVVINTAELIMVVDGESRRVAAGRGATWSISGQLEDNSPYTVEVALTTSTGRVKVFGCRFVVE